MKIEQLSVENFKCFKREQTFDFSRLTVLAGANSSGKSSVMNAILGSIQTGNFPFQLNLNGKYTLQGDFNDIVNQNNNKTNFNISLIFSTNEKISTLWQEEKEEGQPRIEHLMFEIGEIKVEIVRESDNSMTTKLFGQHWDNISNTMLVKSLNEDFKAFNMASKAYISDSNVQEIIIEKSEMNRFEELETIGSIDFFKQETKGKSVEWLSKIYQTIINRIKRYDTKINFIGAYRKQPLRTYLEKNRIDTKIYTEGEGYLEQILEWEKRSNGKIKKLLNLLQNLGLISDIKINRLDGGKFEILVRTKKDGVLTSLSNVGFGVSQFLPIIVADLQLPNDSTLFLAEPEIHLHPSVQSKFGEYIVQQIKETDKNYVIETHSEYFLNRLRLAIVKGDLKKEDLKIYFLDNNGDNTEVYDVDYTKTGAIKNAPKSYFKTYMSDTMDIALHSFAE